MRHGFSLTELLVVIIIIGILGVLASGLLISGMRLTAKVAPETIEQAQEIFLTSNNFYDALYFFKFATGNYTTDDRHGNLNNLIFYTLSNGNNPYNVFGSFRQGEISNDGQRIQFTWDGKTRTLPIYDTYKTNINMYFGDRDLSVNGIVYKPYSNLMIDTGTVQISETKLSPPFPMAVACYKNSTTGAVRTVKVLFSQPIHKTTNTSAIGVVCGDVQANIISVQPINQIGDLYGGLEVTFRVPNIPHLPTCYLYFHNTDDIVSADGWSYADFYTVYGVSPAIGLTTICP